MPRQRRGKGSSLGFDHPRVPCSPACEANRRQVWKPAIQQAWKPALRGQCQNAPDGRWRREAVLRTEELLACWGGVVMPAQWEHVQPPESLGGLVERVTFHNADTGFAVLK